MLYPLNQRGTMSIPELKQRIAAAHDRAMQAIDVDDMDTYNSAIREYTELDIQLYLRTVS